MRLNQIKCDQCGKLFEAPSIYCIPPLKDTTISIWLPNPIGNNQQADFCNEDCLRECLNFRKGKNL